MRRLYVYRNHILETGVFHTLGLICIDLQERKIEKIYEV